MKTIILCGGLGMRMKEETEFRPKPLITIGGKPIFWHIMKGYAHFGFSDFILALGYKGDMIRDYFLHFPYYAQNFTLDTRDQKVTFHDDHKDDWRITFVDSGLASLTGSRVMKCQPYLSDPEFMLTFGDGVSDINIQDLLAFHRRQKTLATISVFHPQSKYGLVEGNLGSGLVSEFKQKPLMKEGVSGGFMVFQKEALRYFDEGDMEQALIALAKKKELSFYVHKGFWKAMDTIRERDELETLWASTQPWALWNQERSPQRSLASVYAKNPRDGKSRLHRVSHDPSAPHGRV